MILTIKKRTIFLIASLILAVVIVGCCIGGGVLAVGGKKVRKLPVYCVDRGEEKVVALTFDAAWGADKTKGIIDILNQHGAKATFFLVGFWIDKFQDEVKLIDQSGFEIGNHSHNHLKMSTISRENIKKEIAYVNEGVKKLTGKDCKVFRPPFGDYNDTLIEEVSSSGMTTIQWDVDSLDWKGIDSAEISKRVCSKVKSGSIVLFHNNSEHILEALPLVLLNLKNEGYTFTTVSDLLIQGEYYIDNNGVQHKQN